MSTHNSLRQKFREAARSCNEWRDTTFYVGLGAACYAAQHFNLPVQPHAFIYGAMARETVRAVTHQYDRTVGDTPASYPAASLGAVSVLGLTAATALGLEQHNLLGYMTSHPQILIGINPLLIAAQMGGGFKNISATYINKLFDYPRHLLPPSHPRKTKLTDKLKNSWKDLVEPQLQPGLIPVPIPIRNFSTLSSQWVPSRPALAA